MSQTEPAFKDKVTAKLIANHLMQHLNDVDLYCSEYAHIMLDRGFSILMEMIDETESYDIYLSLIHFMQELEVCDFGIFDRSGVNAPEFSTFSMRREFVPMASAACIRALRSRGIEMSERDIRSVMQDPCLSLRADPLHPRAMARSLLSSVMGRGRETDV